MIEDVFIGLGSNIQEPIQQVSTAIDTLKTFPDTQWVTSSSLYSNPPMGSIEQPDFINAVAWLKTSLSPLELLSRLQHMEREHGRVRAEPWGPRTLDCDILFFGQRHLDSPELMLPHPGVMTRAFVLVPLAQIAPDFILPTKEKVASVVTADMQASLYMLTPEVA